MGNLLWSGGALAPNGFEPTIWDRERKRDVYVLVSGARTFNEDLAEETD